MCLLTADFVNPSERAAPEKVPDSTTRENTAIPAISSVSRSVIWIVSLKKPGVTKIPDCAQHSDPEHFGPSYSRWNGTEVIMRAVELQAFGSGGLRILERPVPTVRAGEALIRVRAAALNYRDLEIAAGRYGMPVSLPRTPLSDAVGEIVDLGADTSRFAKGDFVNLTFFPDWIDGEFRAEYFARQRGSSTDGVLSEYVLAHETELVRAPANLKDESAGLPVAGLTAWVALSEAALQPGQTVLVIGTGGVSLFALQLATLFGAQPIVVSSSDHRLERALRLGALAAINYRRTPEWGREVRELTSGRGVDVVIETGGAATLPQSTAALRPGGHIAMVGYLGGAELRLDLRELFIGKRARVHGHTVGSRRQLEALNRAVELNRLVPVVDSRYPIDDVEGAYERLRSTEAFGKVLITLQPD
jgi:NADPH:quinone reductase-like Zn-dependent oxidoreductase